MTTPSKNIVVCALYKFVQLNHYQDLQAPLLKTLLTHNVKGTLLLALEGINGTIAGSEEGINAVLAWLDKDAALSHIVTKYSFDESLPFYRTKVKLKKEIVTMGIDGIDPLHVVGTYVKPKDWNNLIGDPDVVLVDTRNDYEVGIGTFKGAINPHTTSFREFPAFVDQRLSPEKNKKVAMFCTGGIRCEKSTAYLKEQGFKEVYHLEGGILKYLEDVEESDSLWQGECFVFDNRVSVNHQLEKGNYEQCHACRRPLTPEDMKKSSYTPGISCHFCINEHSKEQRQRFRERERQVQLAQQRGEPHIGSEAALITRQRKQKKEARKATMRAKDNTDKP